MKTPRPFQTDAIRLGYAKNALIADACGLGKTLDGIEIGKAFRARCSVRWRFLVICPLRVRPQWVQELKEQDPDQPVTIIDPGLPFEWQYQSAGYPCGWYILYYEGVVRKAEELAKWHWDLIICDEAHRLKNRDTKWTREIKRIKCSRKIGLTGTPQERGPQDLWSLGNWLYPDIFTSYWKFFDHYIESDPYTKKVLGVKNTEQLASLLGQFMVRRTKEQVAPELPPRIMQYVDVPLTALQQKYYDELVHAQDVVVRLADDLQGTGEAKILFIANVLTQIVRLQQISTWPGLLDLNGSSSKINWVLDWISDNPDVPVVVFSKFRGTIAHLRSQIGPDASDLVIGGVRELPLDFLEGRKNVLLGTIAAMGEGLNLQRADVAIFIDQEWSTIKMNQAFDRIHRMNIDKPKLIYMLRSTEMDDLVITALNKKWTDMELVYAAVEHWKGGLLSTKALT